MKKIAVLAPVVLSALLLSACGESTDASEDAVADTVEVPADEAMAGVPDPVVDDAVEEEPTVDAVDAEAEEAANAAEATVDDALSAAEAATQEAEAAMQ